MRFYVGTVLFQEVQHSNVMIGGRSHYGYGGRRDYDRGYRRGRRGSLISLDIL